MRSFLLSFVGYYPLNLKKKRDHVPYANSAPSKSDIQQPVVLRKPGTGYEKVGLPLLGCL